MLQVGQKVIYGNYGVCQVTEVDAPMEGVEGHRYYILDPKSERKGRVFLPMDHEDLIRPLMTRDEVISLIDNADTIEIDDFRDNNQRYMEEHFKKLLKTKDLCYAIQVSKTMHFRIKEQAERGASPSATYMRLLDQAEAQINGEFSEVLGIPESEVRAFIAARIEETHSTDAKTTGANSGDAEGTVSAAAKKLRNLFR